MTNIKGRVNDGDCSRELRHGSTQVCKRLESGTKLSLDSQLVETGRMRFLPVKGV